MRSPISHSNPTLGKLIVAIENHISSISFSQSPKTTQKVASDHLIPSLKVKQDCPMTYINFYAQLDSKFLSAGKTHTQDAMKEFVQLAEQVANQFQNDFMHQIKVLEGIDKLSIEFDNNKDVLIGRFPIPKPLWSKFFIDMNNIKETMKIHKKELCFTNNKSDGWKSLNKNLLKTSRFKTAKHKILV